MTFAERYGPWAVVAGASEGTGRAYAEALAAAGLNLVLIARRTEPLEALAGRIRGETGIECVTAAIDLAGPDAHGRILEAVGDREVALYVANAGSDPHGSRFLDTPVEPWLDLVRRNVMTTVQACHHFGGLMRQRKRGGLLLVNSYACYGGGSFMACYTASKAFELAFAESLWSELQPHGVDVLTLVMGMTDTPALRELLDEKGLPLPPDVADPGAVAAFGLAHLADGPIQNWGLAEGEGGPAMSAAERRERVLERDAASIVVFGE
jgi:uncharacterized protein